MSSDRLLKTFEAAAEDSRRFDYFVTSGAGIALGFTLQTFRATGTAIDFLAPVSWALLLMSMGAGLTRLQAKVTTLNMSMGEHALEEELEDLRATTARGDMAQHRVTGAVIGGPALLERIKELSSRHADTRASIRRVQRGAVLAIVIRNVGLLSGVGAFALWRLFGLLL